MSECAKQTLKREHIHKERNTRNKKKYSTCQSVANEVKLLQRVRQLIHQRAQKEVRKIFVE